MNLNEIAKWCLQDNQYSANEILGYPYLKLQILNNKLYVIDAEYISNSLMEQRQYSLCKMIENVCNNYKLPNVIFTYCTHDRTPDVNGSFFTHARLKNISSRNILAPCFTFYGYPEKEPNIIKKYSETYEYLLNNSKSWNLKQNILCFVGSITNSNYRKENTTVSPIDVEVLINNQGADSKNFINREYLSNFKYLLHLNGNNGAYASRFKYLLATKSLSIYNYNSGNENNFWEEFWMYDKYFKENIHFISAKNSNEVEIKLNYFQTNQEKAESIGKNGYDFFSKFLNPKQIECFWNELLWEYKNRCNFEINEQLGNLFQENSYEN
jgi:hypothetical protein